MSRPQPPSLQAKKPPAPWDRLKPVRQDPLEAIGFVSKGDKRLLDIKAQESFYRTIVDRYMHFCSRHSKNLDDAFQSLAISDPSPSSDPTRNPPVRPTNTVRSPPAPVTNSQSLATSRWASSPAPAQAQLAPEDEMSAILTALRKLREGLLATASSAESPVFSQRVHVFNIRAAILALHPPSYHPSLSYLLLVLHTKDHPLTNSELREMTSYMILDMALRQDDLIAAYALRHKSSNAFNYSDRNIDAILQAVVSGNWVLFWRIRRQVDGYTRALMHWHINTLRKATLKSFGRAYMKVDLKWLLSSATGGEMSWEDLVAKEAVGWSSDGANVTIRKPKTKP